MQSIQTSIKGRIIAALALFLISTACGRPETPTFSSWTQEAPKNASEAGYILRVSSKKQVQEVLDRTGAQGRVLHTPMGLYEIRGLTREQLVKEFPNTELIQNQSYENFFQKEKSTTVPIPSRWISPLDRNASVENPIPPRTPTEPPPLEPSPEIAVDPPLRPFRAARAFETQDRTTFDHLAAIEAESAWTQSKGQGLLIAIVDTGVNYNHPDLRQNIFEMNAESIPSNDHPGERIGWDFVHGDALPFDDHGHGTAVAGLAASAVMGVAPLAKILPVKVMNAAARGDTASLLAGILYAVDRGAQIINTSLGSKNPALGEALRPAILYAARHHAIVVSSSGNGDKITDTGLNIDADPYFPASLDEENLLVVAATERSGKLTAYSNFGFLHVHLAAPGGSADDGPLMAPHPFHERRNYQRVFGTSMAAPLVSGAAAVLWAFRPEFSSTQILTILHDSAREIKSLKGKVNSGGILNLKNAMALAEKNRSLN